MPQSGHIVFTKMDEVVYGTAAAPTVAELVKRDGAERVFLMVSGTLNRETTIFLALAALFIEWAGPRRWLAFHSPMKRDLAAIFQSAMSFSGLNNFP